MVIQLQVWAFMLLQEGGGVEFRSSLYVESDGLFR